ncbi:predicted protein [Naegleria gruberi]|uniref:Predicted protein n=1 Tax=Naegleria gruberi TaxID=5762 RepID=D2V706_NAEGR|nr:uncharacterized protein NAEGRDRAFT_64622 [Naegleria gruberi]EFC47173.1 predicted protein [Naegleria gruberi]|eukprot:XP_002679917.1 predicted protein [Naegleria gruberi strain NEG-M]
MLSTTSQIDKDNDSGDESEGSSELFKGYIKIDSSNKHWDMDQKQTKLFKKVKWVATEKVHGANFCFFMNEDLGGNIHIECAKRKSILSENDQFFYFQKLKERLTSKLENIFRMVKTNYPDLIHVYLFGEIFGGFYPNMPKLEGIEQPVQTGIWYTNDIEFYAFDIAIQKSDLIQIYLDYEVTLEIFSKSQLLYAEPLLIASYEECMDMDVKFDSKLPKKLGMPSLNESNYAEGVVIKPMKEINISKKGKLERAIIKRKIQEFSEKKYEQAVKWSTPTSNSSSNSIDELEVIKYEALACITENRLNNAISKIGNIDTKNKVQMNQLLQAYIQDVFDELNESGFQISSSQKSQLEEVITLESKKIIFQYFKKLQSK